MGFAEQNQMKNVKKKIEIFLVSGFWFLVAGVSKPK